MRASRSSRDSWEGVSVEKEGAPGGSSYLSCPLKIQLAGNFLGDSLNIRNRALVRKIRVLKLVLKLAFHLLVLPQLPRPRKHLSQLEFGRDGRKEDTNRLLIVHMLIAKLSNKRWQLLFPS
jgi:hypothetical protein